MKPLFNFCLIFLLFCNVVYSEEPTASLLMTEKALAVYESDVGTYPSSTQGLSALTRRPIEVSPERWKGPYLEKVPIDPWGDEFVYKFPGTHEKPYDLSSIGADRIAGTGDDIVNWDVKKSPAGKKEPALSPVPLPPELDPGRDYMEKAGGLNLPMVWLNPGQFIYVSHRSGAGPPLVALDGYWISRYEISARQYCIFLNAAGDPEKMGYAVVYEDSTIAKKSGKFLPRAECEDKPAYPVSWIGADAFCRMLSKGTGLNYNLPTEAECERAAGGGLKFKPYPWGDQNPEGRANYGHRGGKDFELLTPVGSFSPNHFGLFDMAGNVLEWCRDWYDVNVELRGVKNPAGPGFGNEKVLRGGGFRSQEQFIRIDQRLHNLPWFKNGGFRIVREP